MTARWCRLVLVGVLLTGAAASLPAQTFRSGVDAVSVDVLVTRDGRPVAGLTADDFTLLDNGVEQRIDTLLFDEVPITLLLALDVSGSVGGAGLEQLRAAVRAAGESLRPDDRVGLLTFSDRIRLALEPPSSADRLAAALGRVRAGGATALYDATFTALALREQTVGRMVVLLFSDGDDTASWLDPRDVFDMAQRSDVVVYGVTLDRGGPDTLITRQGRELARQWFTLEPEIFRREFLWRLVGDTGGSLEMSDDLERLRDTFARVVHEFRSRYLLGYSPSGVATDGWHDLEVRVDGGGEVTARRGYLR